MAAYVLPELPYDYHALEPHISETIMRLHHDKHHGAYVAGANAALRALREARDSADASRVSQLTRDLAFNLAGHINHSIFWHNLSPEGGGKPHGALLDAIVNDFGSFERFAWQFESAATSIQGSGWAMLALDPTSSTLVVLQLHDHHQGLAAGLTPLLLLDMWEHAFYLDYHNAKADYVAAFWKVVNWDDVAQRLAAAQANPAA